MPQKQGLYVHTGTQKGSGKTAAESGKLCSSSGRRPVVVSTLFGGQVWGEEHQQGGRKGKHGKVTEAWNACQGADLPLGAVEKLGRAKSRGTTWSDLHFKKVTLTAVLSMSWKAKAEAWNPGGRGDGHANRSDRTTRTSWWNRRCGGSGEGEGCSWEGRSISQINTIGKEALWERYFCFLFCYLTTILLVELLTGAESHPGQGWRVPHHFLVWPGLQSTEESSWPLVYPGGSAMLQPTRAPAVSDAPPSGQQECLWELCFSTWEPPKDF